MDINSRNTGAAGKLSNFTPRRFEIREIPCNSMEGFLQGLKFKNPDMQKEVFLLTGRIAKAKGRNKRWYTKRILYFQGQEIKRDSQEYQDLLDEAFVSLYTKNEKAKKFSNNYS